MAQSRISSAADVRGAYATSYSAYAGSLPAGPNISEPSPQANVLQKLGQELKDLTQLRQTLRKADLEVKALGTTALSGAPVGMEALQEGLHKAAHSLEEMKTKISQTRRILKTSRARLQENESNIQKVFDRVMNMHLERFSTIQRGHLKVAKAQGRRVTALPTPAETLWKTEALAKPRFEQVKPFCTELKPAALGGLSKALEQNLEVVLSVDKGSHEMLEHLLGAVIQSCQQARVPEADMPKALLLPLAVNLLARLPAIQREDIKGSLSYIIQTALGRLVCANLQGVGSPSDWDNRPPNFHQTKKLVGSFSVLMRKQFPFYKAESTAVLEHALAEGEFTLQDYFANHADYLIHELQDALGLGDESAECDPFDNQWICYTNATSTGEQLVYQLAVLLRHCARLIQPSDLGAAVNELTRAFISSSRYMDRFRDNEVQGSDLVDEADNSIDVQKLLGCFDTPANIRELMALTSNTEHHPKPVEQRLSESSALQLLIQEMKSGKETRKQMAQSFGLSPIEFNNFFTLVAQSQRLALFCEERNATLSNVQGSFEKCQAELDQLQSDLKKLTLTWASGQAASNKTLQALTQAHQNLSHAKAVFKDEWCCFKSPLKRLFAHHSSFDAFALKHLMINRDGLAERLQSIPVASSYYPDERLHQVFQDIFEVINQPQFCRPEVLVCEDILIEHADYVGWGLRRPGTPGGKPIPVAVFASRVSVSRATSDSPWVITHLSPLAGAEA